MCDPIDRVFLCKVVLHAADISNPVRSFDVDYFMSDRVQAEFKCAAVPSGICHRRRVISRNQTEKERELGLPVSAHMDIRTEAMKYQAEVNFIDFIVTPLWSTLSLPLMQNLMTVCGGGGAEGLAQILPSLTLCLHQMKANREKFESLAELAKSRDNLESNA